MSYHLVNWWWPAVSSSQGLVYLFTSLTCLSVGAMACGALPRLGARRRPVRPLDTSGTATLEFVLVTPLLLFTTLLLVQTGLLFSGLVYVHYGAFAATRSAIVQIPVDAADAGEPTNVVRPWSSQKHQAIRRAAVLSMLPISGRLEQSSPEDAAFVAALQNMYTDLGQTPPNWVGQLVPGRLAYAEASSDVFLVDMVDDGQVRFVDLEVNQPHRFGPKDPVTVRLEHAFCLSIPYAKAIFADQQTDIGPQRFSQALIQAQYTLTNEGISDQLPSPPAIPRLP